MSQTPACPDVPDAKEAAARVVEIRRLLGIFARGCPNSEIVNGEPEACEECTTQIFVFIQNVVEGRAYDADRASRALPSTALAARPEEGWQIKLLEWKRPPGAITLKRGATEIGTYRSWTHAEAAGEWFWEFANIDGSGPVVDGSGASEIEVQAAAQADYENRIRSAFVAPSTPPTAGDGHD